MYAALIELKLLFNSKTLFHHFTQEYIIEESTFKIQWIINILIFGS